MATIDEVLAGISNESVTYAIDEVLFIDPVTRQISIPGKEMVFGVEGDGKSERKYFQCPRYVGNDIDLASCLFRVNFQNANGQTDFNLIDDMTVSDDGKTITFSWELSPNVTAYKGQVKFVICATRPSDNTAWHTTQATGIVLVGLEPDSTHVESATADGIAQLVEMVDRQTAAVEAEGATQVSAVKIAAKTAETASVAEIEAKGKNTLESIPDDYTALGKAVDTLTRSRAGAIVCEAAGSVVAVNDASDMPIQGLRVFGKTSQVTTTGAQMFDKNAAVVGMLEENGSIVVDGAYVTSDFIPVMPKTAYYQTEKASIRAKYYDADKNPLSGTWDVQIVGAHSFTTFENAHFIRLTVSVKLVDSFMLNLGTEGLPYEPYSGGKPSPSPEYPQELASPTPVVSVCGKNLLKHKIKTETVNGVTFSVSEDGTITANGTATKAAFFGIGPDLALIPGESYVLSGCPDGGEFDTYMLYIHHKNSGFDVYNRSGETKFTAKDESFSTVAVVYEGVTVNNLVFHPMLRHSSVEDGSYKAYTEQNISVSQAIPGVPVTDGGNYTDENGQQWICDEVDFERGVYVQRVYEEVFDGSDDEIISIDQPGTNTYHYTIRTKNMLYQAIGFCSHYPLVGIYSTNSDEGFCPIANSIVRFRWGEEKTLAGFKAELQSDPVSVLYALLTPIETPLSETELAAYAALHSNKPNTVVLNDSGAHMVVKYAADTKLYIDNKIAAITAQT